MKPLVIIEEAELDVVDAHAWYEQQRPGLGDKCLAELRAAIGRVHTEPHVHPHIEGGIQRLLVRRFPYVILYRTNRSETDLEATKSPTFFDQ